MTITANFKHKGLSGRGEIKIADITLENSSVKQWVATISATVESNIFLIGHESAPYVEGADPLKQIYDTMKLSGDYSNIADS